LGKSALSPGWIHRAACRDSDPDIFDTELGPAGEARRICRTCPVRRECLQSDLASGFTPGAIRAGIGETTLDALARAYGEYRAAVAGHHKQILAAAARREAVDGADAGLALRALAAAVQDCADTLTGYALATAAGVPVVPADDEQPARQSARARELAELYRADLVRAHQAHRTAQVRLAAVEKAAGEAGETPEAMRARMRLMTLAGEAAREAATAPAVTTVTTAAARVPAARTLAGAA
jgi:hypothetical protein